MKKLIIIILITLIFTICSAEVQRSLGVSSGLLTAGGFSYRQFNQQTGYQINFIAIGTKEYFPILLGSKILRSFHETDFSKIYYLAGGSITSITGSDSDNETIVNIGGGIGFEFTLKSNLRLSFDIPCTFIDIFDNADIEINVISLVPDIGLHYYF